MIGWVSKMTKPDHENNSRKGTLWWLSCTSVSPQAKPGEPNCSKGERDDANRRSRHDGRRGRVKTETTSPPIKKRPVTHGDSIHDFAIKLLIHTFLLGSLFYRLKPSCSSGPLFPRYSHPQNVLQAALPVVKNQNPGRP
ncbi:hypothetical protein CLAIMM_02914 isoform 5 [Cladophialophora immunda]|nr:hypothetical protein CLAIMM_02914 isoform 1 [Cladophialophora immunda]OQU96896.1 hypothetical protein CLAIMM_02914 isoform 2 [Cladophialophora immunda]OQU96897.1 hypothetical protein CLAIMM_02914 isoform 3 [Cladophialophora immunda]OQU96898.1 hypothetical protein CLAIMM_02914 isoform 5 [Cladophialophora immunda]